MIKQNGVLYNVTEADLELLENNPNEFWEDVEEIGKEAFQELSSLKIIKIPEGIKKSEKKHLKNVKIFLLLEFQKV